MPPTLAGARLVIVSGKGGVGKTTVAAAIAVAAARTGKQVLLAEIEDREAFAPLFGLSKLGYEEMRLAPNLTGIEIEADESLVEYLQHFYGIPRISRALVHSRAVEFATHTAPGLGDILLIGKVKEAEQRRRQGQYAFDLIVLDAPPTGRLPRFLDAPRSIVSLVRGGPIKTQAQSVLDMVQNPERCHVVLVSHAEEMPVRETAEAYETLQKMGIALGPVIVNGVWPQIDGIGKDARATLTAANDVGLSASALDALTAVVDAQTLRARNQRAAIKTLRDEVDLPQIELPYLFTERVGRTELESLADELVPCL